MKKVVICFMLIQLTTVFSSDKVSSSFEEVSGGRETQLKAAKDVLVRVLGIDKVKLFQLEIKDRSDFKNDGFYIRKHKPDKKVLVSGPNAVSLCWGVHYYLKEFCKCHISWNGDQLNLPQTLPDAEVTIEAKDKLRYYQNACTSSYSFVWWNWDRWEREIDWMALNGVNLALAATAQEAIWQRVYDSIYVKSNEFTGPAFLAWNRMGNLRNLGNGLTKNWHVAQLNLQHLILNRMRELGIKPILPAFCGIVPQSLQTAYPLGNYTKMSKWGRFSKKFCCPLFLDSSDPIFALVAQTFLKEIVTEFGTDNYYSCDAFNENVPISGDSNYLSGFTKSVYNHIRLYDPKAVWVMQGWMFLNPFWIVKERVKAYLSGVPTGGLLILDLQSGLTPQFSKFENYYGHNFIWCTLNNFGGQLGMYGYLQKINTGIVEARKFEGSTMVGVGITPEGIGPNYVIYDFTLESSLRSEPVNLSTWISDYALRRYGVHHSDLLSAWLILKDTVYKFEHSSFQRENIHGTLPSRLLYGEHISRNILTILPSLNLNEPVWYNRSELVQVFLKFHSAMEDKRLASNELFKHDLIDVTRQLVQVSVSRLYFDIIFSFFSNDLENLEKNSQSFLSLLDELDKILGTGEQFLLGKWLEDAKSCAKNEEERINYEFNARNQITLWGPRGEIRDYAAKHWAGLVADFYKPRWNIFLTALHKAVVDGVPYSKAKVKREMFEKVEKPFGKSRKVYPSEAQEDTIPVIREFSRKWINILEKLLEKESNRNEASL